MLQVKIIAEMKKEWSVVLVLLLVSTSLFVTPTHAQTQKADSLKLVLAREKAPFTQFTLNKQIAESGTVHHRISDADMSLWRPLKQICREE